MNHSLIKIWHTILKHNLHLKYMRNPTHMSEDTQYHHRHSRQMNTIFHTSINHANSYYINKQPLRNSVKHRYVQRSIINNRKFQSYRIPNITINIWPTNKFHHFNSCTHVHANYTSIRIIIQILLHTITPSHSFTTVTLFSTDVKSSVQFSSLQLITCKISSIP